VEQDILVAVTTEVVGGGTADTETTVGLEDTETDSVQTDKGHRIQSSSSVGMRRRVDRLGTTWRSGSTSCLSMTIDQELKVAANVHQPPSAPLVTSSFRRERPQIVGPDTPEAPFPIYLSGVVQRGFGRGGKDLGCPTGTCTLCYVACVQLNRWNASKSTG
jgi:hypothetical protein